MGAALALSVTACGGSSSSASTSTPAADGHGGNGTQRVTLRLALGSTSFAWLPVYVAQGAGLFDQEGIDLKVTQTSAGQTTTAALLSGDIDLAGVGTQATFQANQKGEQTKIVAVMTKQFTSVIFGRKDTFQKLGVTPDSPIADRVKALGKTTVGVTTIGSGSDLIFRYIMSLYGDDPAKMKIVPAGDSTATLGAMQAGRIDASPFSPPVPQKAIADGYGEVLIDTIKGEVPELDGMTYTAISTSPKALKDKRNAIVRFAMALGKADEMVHNDPAKAAAAAKSVFAQTPESLYRQGFDSMVPAIPDDSRVSADGMNKAKKVLEAAYDTTFDFPITDVVDYSVGADAYQKLNASS